MTRHILVIRADVMSGWNISSLFGEEMDAETYEPRGTLSLRFSPAWPGEPPFRQRAVWLRDLLSQYILAGYGISKFEIPLLQAEFAAVGIEFNPDVVDSLELWDHMEPRTLGGAYRYFCHQGLLSFLYRESAILRAQLKRWECDIPGGIEEAVRRLKRQDPTA